MLLIEEKSLEEIYELYILSNLKNNYPYMTIAIIETEIRIMAYKFMKPFINLFNEYHAKFPYGL